MAGENLRPRMPEGSGGHTYYVDATNGADTNPGTLASPFKSITKALSVVVAGDCVYLRTHQNQIYRPAPGKRTLGAGSAALTFTEVASPSGLPVRIRLRSGASTVVTVYGNDIDIQFAAGATADGVKTVYDANGAATALASCTSGGAGTVAAAAWTGARSHVVIDQYFPGTGEVQGVHSHEIYNGGNLGATPPGTANPITIEAYPADIAAGYSPADVRPRAGMPSPTPKNETGSDGVTAAALLGTNVPGGTGTITLVLASHWPNNGSFTLAGITGTIHYTSRSGNTLNGLHDGGTAISGTVSASALATFDGGLVDTSSFLFQKPDGTFPDGIRLRNLKISGQTGNRGAGIAFNGNGSTDGVAYCEVYGCELTGNYYQAYVCNNASNNIQFINCNIHDNGTGQQSTPSNALTAPDSQQHNGYLEGNNNTLLNCILRDAPWGTGLQYRVAGSGLIVAHCTIVRNGWGTGSTIGDGMIFDSITSATIKNCVIFDNKAYSMHENTLLPANALTEDHNILSQLGALGVNNNYYADNTGTGASTPYAAWNEAGGSVSRLTADPGFVNYATRDLRPVAGSAIVSQAVDKSYSPAFDITGKIRSGYTAGAYDFPSALFGLRSRADERSRRQKFPPEVGRAVVGAVYGETDDAIERQKRVDFTTKPKPAHVRRRRA